jgi:hypothetical protein
MRVDFGVDAQLQYTVSNEGTNERTAAAKEDVDS